MFRTPEPGRFECRAGVRRGEPVPRHGGFIAAGMDGIERELDPGEPIVGQNMYELPLEEMRRARIGFIPQSLAEALDEFEADEVVQSALGPELAAEFLGQAPGVGPLPHDGEPLGDRPLPDAVLTGPLP